MPIPGLTDEESKAVIAALKKLIVEDNSLSPLLNPHKSALAKLDPRTPTASRFSESLRTKSPLRYEKSAMKVRRRRKK